MYSVLVVYCILPLVTGLSVVESRDLALSQTCHDSLDMLTPRGSLPMWRARSWSGEHENVGSSPWVWHKSKFADHHGRGSLTASLIMADPAMLQPPVFSGDKRSLGRAAVERGRWSLDPGEERMVCSLTHFSYSNPSCNNAGIGGNGCWVSGLIEWVAQVSEPGIAGAPVLCTDTPSWCYSFLSLFYAAPSDETTP